MAQPGSLVPPLNLSMGSSASTGPNGGGTVGAGGMGALTQGDWIIQRTGTGNNSATPAANNQLMMLAVGAAVVWFLMRKP